MKGNEWVGELQSEVDDALHALENVRGMYYSETFTETELADMWNKLQSASIRITGAMYVIDKLKNDGAQIVECTEAIHETWHISEGNKL